MNCTLKHAFDELPEQPGLENYAGTCPYRPQIQFRDRELIKSMLAPKPSQRPLIHDVLRNPLIKRNIANFMSDIAERPKNRIGDGTMVVRKAILKVANAGNNLGQTMRRLDQNAAKDMESLIQQLKSLGLDNVVRKALRSSQSTTDDDTSTSSSSSSKSHVPRRVSHQPRRHNGPRHDNPPPPAPSRRVLEARKEREKAAGCIATRRREEKTS